MKGSFDNIMSGLLFIHEGKLADLEKTKGIDYENRYIGNEV